MKPKKMIPYGRQEITQTDIDAVTEVLQSDFLTQGPRVPKFELELSQYCGSNHAVAANSATSALHIACLALDIGHGDLVWTSAITFVASSNCALYCGADVDFVDIDPLTYNMCPLALEKKLSIASKSGKLPKVLIPVHLCGQSCDMEEIHKLSLEYGFKIIEDASHAIGAKFKDSKVGKCDFSDITVFSFHPVKIITTAEGGIAVTNNPSLDNKMRLFRSHGITGNESDFHLRPSEEVWNYQQIDLGFNYRMTDIQAALGLSQITRVDEFVTKRNTLAKKYNDSLVNLPLQLPKIDSKSYSSFHLYVIRVCPHKTNKTHKEVYNSLYTAQIMANLHYIPVYLHPYYEKLGFKRGQCPNAEKYYSEAISIPLYPGLSDKEQDYIIKTIRDIFE